MDVSANDLVLFLKTLVPPDAKFLDRLKIVYRPLICPLHKLLRIVPAHSSVFDFGCGNGSFLALTAKFCNPSKLGGIEINDTLVTNANHLLKNTFIHVPIHVSKYDGVVVPSFINEYDYVFMTDVFHHIPIKLREDIFHQLYQKMKTGSVFVIKDIDAASLLHYFNKLHDLAAAGEIGNEVSVKDMTLLLTSIGFKIESSEKERMLWYPHYTLVCRK